MNTAEGFAAAEGVKAAEPLLKLTPEMTARLRPAQARNAAEREVSAKNLSPGITGLSGRTDQQWEQAPPIAVDESRTTTIRIRLVCGGDDGPRPLAPKTPRDTPAPAPVG